MHNKIQIVFGPTASGKTDFSVKMAEKLGKCEIINADSMQVYSEIPILTNQPTSEEKKGIPHHLFGVKSISTHSDMAKWLKDAVPLVKEVRKRKNTPILVGGTGMYLRSMIEGISEIPDIPKAFKDDIRKEIEILGISDIYKKLIDADPLSKELNQGDSQRVIRAYEVFKFTGKSIFDWNQDSNRTFFDKDEFEIHFIDKPKEEIYDNINKRFENMVNNGLLDEVKNANEIFKNSGLSIRNLVSLPAYKAHGLREVISYLNGEIEMKDAITMAQQTTRNYAKRQFTWWRGWSKSLGKI